MKKFSKVITTAETSLPNHGGRKVNSPRPQRFLVGEGRISMRKLSIRNSGEGTTYTNTPPLVAKAAFTLAEVLITLAIIGVVAALTLPTLIAKVNEKVDGNQKKVTEAKLIQGLNMLDLHGGINNTYSSTAEFVEELSKYMKITKICDGTNSAFTECIPYNEIKYTDSDNEEQTVDVVDLNTAASLGKGDTESGEEFMAPVAMVLADGTPIILTYNKNCISDPDSIKADNKKIHSCVDGLYDLNGSRKPNKFNKDVNALLNAKIGQKKYKWSEWFDSNIPYYPDDDDIETYDKIRALGGQICDKPKDIECRAEAYPDLTIEEIGQKVTCDVNTGLICRGSEQIGVFRSCFNYTIRVLCEE
ncbi:prepilin-type N-terminal cleavage/methylation domain-containing protein [bacterium]|nr:prepilin-type N-terminal cleavage/methylation domain-containing protein [bacterium]